ncbi:cupin domain-containing protein [Streptomyces erythrochromogenes]|uniref:cupin domain-containing protein n=1 Tax=Streptomyces erythrochromogenes TaxID=285574 RepID=UPI0036ADF69D
MASHALPSKSCAGLCDDGVITVMRSDIRAITTVEVDGEVHDLGEHRDFRRNEALASFIPEQGRTSLAWVRLRDGETLAPHQHPTKSMILVCKGSVRLVGDVQQDLAEGDIVCVPPGRLHGFATSAGEEFHGLSVQFEGSGLYEDEHAARVRFTETETGSLAELDELNEELLQRHTRNSLFNLFASGRLQSEPELRNRFVDALYVWSGYFQRMLYARQALVGDPHLEKLYAQHLREEFGHDEMLRKEHDITRRVYDPILEATSSWFVNQMHRADEAAKIVIVHMVVESSGHVFGEATEKIFKSPQVDDGASYFELHAEVDDDHRGIGRDFLRGISATEFPHLMTVCKEAWDQMDLVHERIAAHILAD